MAKKKPIKKIFDSTPIEPAEAHPELTDSLQAGPGDEAMERSSADEKSTDETTVEGVESVSADLGNEVSPAEPNPQEEGMEIAAAQEQSSNESPIPANTDEPSERRPVEDAPVFN
jgi:hypothetical protein